MYGRKEEGASRRADQVIFPLHDFNAGNANQADRTRAIGTVVGRLEIDRDEGRVKPPRSRRNQIWEQSPPSLTPGPFVDEGCNST